MSEDYGLDDDGDDEHTVPSPSIAERARSSIARRIAAVRLLVSGGAALARRALRAPPPPAGPRGARPQHAVEQSAIECAASQSLLLVASASIAVPTQRPCASSSTSSGGDWPPLPSPPQPLERLLALFELPSLPMCASSSRASCCRTCAAETVCGRLLIHTFQRATCGEKVTRDAGVRSRRCCLRRRRRRVLRVGARLSLAARQQFPNDPGAALAEVGVCPDLGVCEDRFQDRVVLHDHV